MHIWGHCMLFCEGSGPEIHVTFYIALQDVVAMLGPWCWNL